MKTPDCNIFVNLVWNEKTSKKDANFGSTWGKLPKSKANATAIKTGNGRVVIDIDTKNLDEVDQDLVKLLPEKPTYETARGYHYHFDHDDGTEYQTIAGYIENVDIRGKGGLIFNSYWGDSKHISYEKIGEVYKLTKELAEWLPIKTKHEKSTYSNEGNGNLSKKEVKNLLTYIDVKKHDDRDSWMKIIAAIHNALGSKGEKIAREWSQGDTEQFDENSFDEIWSQLERGQYGADISAGTLFHLAAEGGYERDLGFKTGRGKLEIIEPKKAELAVTKKNFSLRDRINKRKG